MSCIDKLTCLSISQLLIIIFLTVTSTVDRPACRLHFSPFFFSFFFFPFFLYFFFFSLYSMHRNDTGHASLYGLDGKPRFVLTRLPSLPLPPTNYMKNWEIEVTYASHNLSWACRMTNPARSESQRFTHVILDTVMGENGEFYRRSLAISCAVTQSSPPLWGQQYDNYVNQQDRSFQYEDQRTSWSCS